MRESTRRTIALLAVGVFIAGTAYQHHWFGLGKTADTAQPAPGISDIAECGTKGYHYFKLSTVMNLDGTSQNTPTGPQMVLSTYGAEQNGPDDRGELTFTLSLSTGSSSRNLDLSAPLGTAGVAVEIEGPNGLIGGAHDLPVRLEQQSARLPNGKIRVAAADPGLDADVTMPAIDLCPGYKALAVQKNLLAPTDASSTITGQPPYTVTVSISDPAITTLRAALASTATGPVLAANNLNGP
jgi:hypothetical protein